MAHRLTISDRAVREVGEAYEWYEEQMVGLGNEFLAALEAQFEKIANSPQLYPETQRGAGGRAVLRQVSRPAQAPISSRSPSAVMSRWR